MLDIISIILIIFGLYLFVRSISHSSIILHVMDNRWGREPIDKELFRKINIIDVNRIIKWIFTSYLSGCLIFVSLVALSGLSVNLHWLPIVTLVIIAIKELFKYFTFTKHQVRKTYEDIAEQWKNESVVSERHDEEVVFKRGVDDVDNVWFDVFCLLFIFVVIIA